MKSALWSWAGPRVSLQPLSLWGPTNYHLQSALTFSNSGAGRNLLLSLRLIIHSSSNSSSFRLSTFISCHFSCPLSARCSPSKHKSTLWCSLKGLQSRRDALGLKCLHGCQRNKAVLSTPHRMRRNLSFTTERCHPKGCEGLKWGVWLSRHRHLDFWEKEGTIFGREGGAGGGVRVGCN